MAVPNLICIGLGLVFDDTPEKMVKLPAYLILDESSHRNHDLFSKVRSSISRRL